MGMTQVPHNIITVIRNLHKFIVAYKRRDAFMKCFVRFKGFDPVPGGITEMDCIQVTEPVNPYCSDGFGAIRAR